MQHSTERKFGKRLMYNNPAAPLAGATAAGMGSGALAMTGAGDLFWFALAAFAMLALGLAVKRIVPVKAQKN
ncbi:4-amino-4-deoxy-L-arabinose transferase-like glycosyltransferase [Paenarthrobacter nicotinovorans]|nr:4-amino-4-deoxy-L-arabinose transferase-like glycosyltransferase [Paenarthrobacter nicotinovorans]SCZ58909.1 hypothetical protein SAMN02799638_02573 [Arthrobacter sp. UNCCL28]